jgi:hypothetical protein
MDIVNRCVLYSVLRIAADKGMFFDPEDPRKPMPIVTYHLAELINQCPVAEINYNVKFNGNEDNKTLFMIQPGFQQIVKEYKEKFILSTPGPKPTLPAWENITPLPTDLLPAFNNLPSSPQKERTRKSRKQRKNRKQTRKQRQKRI